MNIYDACVGSTRQQYGRMLALLDGQEPGDQRYRTNQ
jgi:hypothetical protein